MQDTLGLELSGATTESTLAYQAALDDFRRYLGDPAALAAQAAQASPSMTMAHVLTAWLYLLGTEPAGLAVAREACALAAALPANERERMHLAAARLLSQGRWHAAGRLLEDISLLYPQDLLALQAGHLLDFFVGDARLLRDRIARALPHWQRGMPGYHAVLGMHAFGLEETGDYAQAEREGRLAVELEPHDAWAWHAVAHVHEMRNDPQAGAAWLGPNAGIWSEGSFFAVHNWWHLALFQLELGREDEVLRLYDEAIGGPGSSLMVDLVDASAMLWRLHLRGLPLGERGQAVARRWREAGAAGEYAFNDLHMMLAHVLTGDESAQQAVLQAQREALRREDDNARFTGEVGQAATLAIQAYGRGDDATCVDLLRGIRSGAHRFGGSHAQRDLLDQTLLAAAERGGQTALAQALRHERDALRPRSAAARRLPLAA
jgi:hypothetical protein